jgi:hypothetical protein
MGRGKPVPFKAFPGKVLREIGKRGDIDDPLIAFFFFFRKETVGKVSDGLNG